jgi:hypothetical protein
MLTFLQDVLSENNYRLFTGLVLDVLLKPWEKYVMSMKYTEVRGGKIREILFHNGTCQLGAVRFDRDLRAVMAYLTSQTVFGDIREKFVRLQQISTLLNLDSVRGGFIHVIVFPKTDYWITG